MDAQIRCFLSNPYLWGSGQKRAARFRAIGDGGRVQAGQAIRVEETAVGAPLTHNFKQKVLSINSQSFAKLCPCSRHDLISLK
jgi:hypothetical protein